MVTTEADPVAERPLPPRETYPLFKFNDEKYCKSLAESGEIRIGTLYDFRNSEAYDGRILDPGEGKLEIWNHYDHYDGLAKNAEGLIPTLYPPYSHVTASNGSASRALEMPNCHILSMSEYFFTESLWQAKSDRDRRGKRTGCSLITDPSQFFELLGNHTYLSGMRYVDAKSCRYIGRTLTERNPDEQSLTNYYLQYPGEVIFLKPEDHSDYIEVRAAWLPPAEKTASLQPEVLEVPELASLVIPVHVAQAELNALEDLRAGKRDGRVVRAEVHFNDGTPAASFSFSIPQEVLSPVIVENYSGSQRRVLGFRPRSGRTLAGGDVRSAEVSVDTGLCLVCVNTLSRIESLRIKTV